MATNRTATQRKYEDKCKKFCIRCRTDADADIIEWFNNSANASSKLKEMIRNDIKASKMTR